MLRKSVVFFLLIYASAAFCVKGQTAKDKPPKIIAYVVGEWKLQKAYHGKDSTFTDYPVTISFTVDGKYNRTDKNGNESHGTYRINENSSKIYLDPGQNIKPDEWNVRFKNGIMTMQHMPTHAKNKYSYYKIER